MAKPERSFYDRAMEALEEKYPKSATQKRLARLAGVSQPTVNDWKDAFPKMENAVRLAGALGVCVEWLFTERGPKYPPKEADPIRDTLGDLQPSEREEVARFADFVRSRGRK